MRIVRSLVHTFARCISNYVIDRLQHMGSSYANFGSEITPAIDGRIQSRRNEIDQIFGYLDYSFASVV